MKLRILATAIVAMSLLGGCGWKRVPETPVYKTEQNIPITVGFVTINKVSPYSQSIISEMEKAKFFKGVIYPYRADDKVDVVMEISTLGGWKGSGAAAGFVTGLTLGLAGTAVGPSMEGSHKVVITAKTKDGKNIGTYEANATNTVRWGMAANTNEVTKAADDLQIKSLSYETMNKLYADKENILNKTK